MMSMQKQMMKITKVMKIQANMKKVTVMMTENITRINKQLKGNTDHY